jgi:hypothetical protein
LRGGDLNPRPLGYEPNELPDCSTPRHGDRVERIAPLVGVFTRRRTLIVACVRDPVKSRAGSIAVICPFDDSTNAPAPP